jgi:hypothetical protein
MIPRFRSKKIVILILAVLSTVAGIALSGTAGAAVRPGAKYAAGNLTLEAQNATVAELLETIARTAGVDVFVGRGFQPSGQRLSLAFKDEPLEEAVKRVLRGYNYAAIYEKDGNDFRIAALKIYPEGQAGGDVTPLFSGGRTALYEEKNRRGETVTVWVDTLGDIVTRGNLTDRRGALGPSQTEVSPQVQPGDLRAPWFAFQIQAEQDEAERFGKLLLLRKQLESTSDAQKKQALSMVYADEVAKFQSFKKANLSKVESLKRINQFQEITRQ